MESTDNNNPFDDLESWFESNAQFCENCQKLSKTIKNRETVLRKLKSRIISSDKIIKQFQLKKKELSQTQWQLAEVTEKLKKAGRLNQTIQSACREQQNPSNQLKKEFEKKIAEKEAIIKQIQERLKFIECEHKIYKESSEVSLKEVGKLKDEIKRQTKLISVLEQNHRKKTQQVERTKKEIEENKSSVSDMKRHIKSLERELSQLKGTNEKYSQIFLDKGLLPKKELKALDRKTKKTQLINDDVPSVDFISDDEDYDDWKADDVVEKKEVKIPQLIDVDSIFAEFRSFPQMLSPISSVDKGVLDSSMESSEASVNDLAKLLEDEFLQDSELPIQESDQNLTKVVSPTTESVQPQIISCPNFIASSTPSSSNSDSSLKSDLKKNIPADTSLKRPTHAVVETSAVNHSSSDLVDGNGKTKANPSVTVFSANESNNFCRETEFATFGNLSDSDGEEELTTAPQLTSSSSESLTKKPGQGPNYVVDPSKSCTEMTNLLDETEAARNNLESVERVIKTEQPTTRKEMASVKSDMINLFGSEYLSSSSDDETDNEKASDHPATPIEAKLLTSPDQTESPAPLAESPAPLTESPAPLTENESPAPLTENESPAPLTENESPTPLTENESPTPLTENESPTPLTENESPNPLTENESPTPLTENGPLLLPDMIKSPIPVETNPQNIPLESKTIVKSPSIETKKPISITNTKSDESNGKSSVLQDHLTNKGVRLTTVDEQFTSSSERNQLDNKILQQENQREIIDEVKENHKDIINEVKENHKDIVDEVKENHKDIVDEVKENHKDIIDEVKENHKDIIDEVKENHKDIIDEVKENHKDIIDEVKENHKDIIDEVKENHKDIIDEVKENHKDIIDEVKENHKDIIDEVKENHKDIIDEVKENHKDIIDEVKENHKDIINTKENHKDNNDVKENHKDNNDVKENHKDNNDVKENHKDNNDVKENHKDINDVKENHKDINDVKENHKDINDVKENHKDIINTKQNHKDTVDMQRNHKEIDNTKRHEDVSEEFSSSSTEEFKMGSKTKPERLELSKNDAENTSFDLFQESAMDDVTQEGAVNNSPSSNALCKTQLEISKSISDNPDPCERILGDDSQTSPPSTQLHTTIPSNGGDKSVDDATVPKRLDKLTSSPENNVPAKKPNVLTETDTNKVENSPSSTFQSNSGDNGSFVDPDSIFDVSESLLGINGYSCMNGSPSNDKENKITVASDKSIPSGISLKKLIKAESLTNSAEEPHISQCNSADDVDYHQSVNLNGSKSLSENSKDAESSTNATENIPEKQGSDSNSFSENINLDILKDGGRENGKTVCNFNKLPQNIENSESSKVSIGGRLGNLSKSSEISRYSETLQNDLEKSTRLDCFHNSSEDIETSSNIKTDSLEKIKELEIISRLNNSESFKDCIDAKRLNGFNPFFDGHPESETLRNETEENGTKFDDSSTSKSESLENFELSENGAKEENGEKSDCPVERVVINRALDGQENGTKEISEKFHKTNGVSEDTEIPDHQTENVRQSSTNNRLPFIGVNLESEVISEVPEGDKSSDLNVCDNPVTGENSILSNTSNDSKDETLSSNVNNPESNDNVERTSSASVDNSQSNNNVKRTLSVNVNNSESNDIAGRKSLASIDNSQSNDTIEQTLSVNVNNSESNDNAEKTLVNVNNSESNDNAEKTLTISVNNSESIDNVEGTLSVNVNNFESNDNAEKTLSVNVNNSESVDNAERTLSVNVNNSESNVNVEKTLSLNVNSAESNDNAEETSVNVNNSKSNDNAEKTLSVNVNKSESNDNVEKTLSVNVTSSESNDSAEKTLSVNVNSAESNDSAEKTLSVNVNSAESNDKAEETLSVNVNNSESNDNAEKTLSVNVNNSESNDNVEETLSVNVNNSESNDNAERKLSVNVNKSESNDNAEGTSLTSVDNCQSNDNVKGTLSIIVNKSQNNDNVKETASVCVNNSLINSNDDCASLINVNNPVSSPFKNDTDDFSKDSIPGDVSSMDEFSDLDSTELVSVPNRNHVDNVDINELFGDDDDDDDLSNPESEGRVPTMKPKNTTSSLSNDSVPRINNCDSSPGVINQNSEPVFVNKVNSKKYNMESPLVDDAKIQAQLNGFNSSLSRKKRKPVYRMAADPNIAPKLSRRSVADELCKAKTDDAVIKSTKYYIKFVASSEKLFLPSLLVDAASHDNPSPSIKEAKKDAVPVVPISEPPNSNLRNLLPSKKVPQLTGSSRLPNDAEEVFARRSTEDVRELIKEFILVARPISPLPATPDKSIPQFCGFSTPLSKEPIDANISSPTSDCDYGKDIKPLVNMVPRLSPIVTPKKLQERRSKKNLSKDFGPDDGTETVTVNGARQLPKTLAADTDSGNGENKTDLLLDSDSSNRPLSKPITAETNPAMEVDASQSSADKKCLITQQRLLRKTRASHRICPAPVTSSTKNPKLDPKKQTNGTEPKKASKNPTTAKLHPPSSSPQKMDISSEATPKLASGELQEPNMEIADSVEPVKVSSLGDPVDDSVKSEKSVRKRKLDKTEASPVKLPEEKKQCVKNDAILSRARTSLMKVAQRELQTYWRYVSSAPCQVLQKLLQTNREADLIVDVVSVQAVKLLSSTTDDMLPWYITKCKSNEATPYFSDKEKHLLRLLCLFKKKKDMGHIFSKFRECLQDALTKQDWNSTTLGKWSLCRMYIAMCRLEGCLSETRVFFYETFCRLPCEQYVTFAVVTACTWPLVLSYEKIDGQVSLFRVIEYAVIKCINEKPHNKKYLECLAKHCKWKPSGSNKDNDIQRCLFRHLHDCIEEGATKDEIICYVKGVELLSLQEKWLWTMTLLRSRISNLLKKCLQLEPPEDRKSEFNCLLCHVFQMLGNLCMKNKERHKTITFVINSLLKPFLISDKFSPEVHLCCARVVMKLSPFEPIISYPILQTWFEENICWEPSSKLMSQWILLKDKLNKETGVT